MTKQFKVVSRETGEKYPLKSNEFIMLYDSGYPAVVGQDYYTYIVKIDPKKWEVKWRKGFIYGKYEMADEDCY